MRAKLTKLETKMLHAIQALLREDRIWVTEVMQKKRMAIKAKELKKIFPLGS
jgi:hypothetical protein